MQITARTKLAEKPIHWEESYTEETLGFKEMYEDIIGPGSYFRWEGKDADSGDEYVCIVGPASIKDPEPKFFAGVRKLPSDYPAGGEYFSELQKAMEKANETWGVPLSDFENYDESDMRKIGERVDEYKEAKDRAKEEESEEEKVANMQFMFIRTAQYPFFKKITVEAMGAKHWKGREGYACFDADTVYTDPNFLNMVEEEKAKGTGMDTVLMKAADIAQQEKKNRRKKLEEMYGPEYATANSGFHHTFLAIKMGEGFYVYSVGPYRPYFGMYFPGAQDKFGIYRRKLNIATQSLLQDKIQELQEKFAAAWGIQIDPETDISEKSAKPGEMKNFLYIALNKNATKKLLENEKFQKAMKFWGIDTTQSGWLEKLKQVHEDFKDKNSETFKAWQKLHQEQAAKILNSGKKLTEEYRKKVLSGEAFLDDMPPPPAPSWINASVKIGQQKFSTITREVDEGDQDAAVPAELAGKSEAKTDAMMAVYGFTSMQETLAYLSTKEFKGLPMPKDYVNITMEDLKKAREEKEAKDKAEGKTPAAPKTKNVKEMEKVVEPARPDGEKPKPSVKPQEVHPEDSSDVSDIDWSDEHINTKGSSVTDLIKLSAKYDAEGKFDKAKEIHEMLKKYFNM